MDPSTTNITNEKIMNPGDSSKPSRPELDDQRDKSSTTIPSPSQPLSNTTTTNAASNDTNISVAAHIIDANEQISKSSSSPSEKLQNASLTDDAKSSVNTVASENISTDPSVNDTNNKDNINLSETNSESNFVNNVSISESQKEFDAIAESKPSITTSNVSAADHDQPKSSESSLSTLPSLSEETLNKESEHFNRNSNSIDSSILKDEITSEQSMEALQSADNIQMKGDEDLKQCSVKLVDIGSETTPTKESLKREVTLKEPVDEPCPKKSRSDSESIDPVNRLAEIPAKLTIIPKEKETLGSSLSVRPKWIESNEVKKTPSAEPINKLLTSPLNENKNPLSRLKDAKSSVTVTKLSSGISQCVESKDLKTILGTKSPSTIETYSRNPLLTGDSPNRKKSPHSYLVEMHNKQKKSKMQQQESDSLNSGEKSNNETKECRKLPTSHSKLDQIGINDGSGVRNPQQVSSDKSSNNSSPVSSISQASSRSNSPLLNQQSSHSSSSQHNLSNVKIGSEQAEVKLIKDDKDSLMIEGRPKLTVSKVNHKTTEIKLGSSSPTEKKLVAKLKLPSTNTEKLNTNINNTKSDPLSFSDDSNSNGMMRGLKRKCDSWTKESSPSFTGKLKIKLPVNNSSELNVRSSLIPSSTSISSVSNNLSANSSIRKDEDGLSFAFAGKPTYSPSRVEPSSNMQGKESPRDASNKDSPASQADSGVYSIASSNSPSKDGTTSGTSPDSPNRDRMPYTDQTFNRESQWKAGVGSHVNSKSQHSSLPFSSASSTIQTSTTSSHINNYPSSSQASNIVSNNSQTSQSQPQANSQQQHPSQGQQQLQTPQNNQHHMSGMQAYNNESLQNSRFANSQDQMFSHNKYLQQQQQQQQQQQMPQSQQQQQQASMADAKMSQRMPPMSNSGMPPSNGANPMGANVPSGAAGAGRQYAYRPDFFGNVQEPAVKRKRGRPRKNPPKDPSMPKRQYNRKKKVQSSPLVGEDNSVYNFEEEEMQPGVPPMRIRRTANPNLQQKKFSSNSEEDPMQRGQRQFASPNPNPMGYHPQHQQQYNSAALQRQRQMQMHQQQQQHPQQQQQQQQQQLSQQQAQLSNQQQQHYMNHPGSMVGPQENDCSYESEPINKGSSIGIKIKIKRPQEQEKKKQPEAGFNQSMGSPEAMFRQQQQQQQQRQQQQQQQQQRQQQMMNKDGNPFSPQNNMVNRQQQSQMQHMQQMQQMQQQQQKMQQQQQQNPQNQMKNPQLQRQQQMQQQNQAQMQRQMQQRMQQANSQNPQSPHMHPNMMNNSGNMMDANNPNNAMGMRGQFNNGNMMNNSGGNFNGNNMMSMYNQQQSQQYGPNGSNNMYMNRYRMNNMNNMYDGSNNFYQGNNYPGMNYRYNNMYNQQQQQFMSQQQQGQYNEHMQGNNMYNGNNMMQNQQGQYGGNGMFNQMNPRMMAPGSNDMSAQQQGMNSQFRPTTANPMGMSPHDNGGSPRMNTPVVGMPRASPLARQQTPLVSPQSDHSPASMHTAVTPTHQGPLTPQGSYGHPMTPAATNMGYNGQPSPMTPQPIHNPHTPQSVGQVYNQSGQQMHSQQAQKANNSLTSPKTEPLMSPLQYRDDMKSPGLLSPNSNLRKIRRPSKTEIGDDLMSPKQPEPIVEPPKPPAPKPKPKPQKTVMNAKDRPSSFREEPAPPKEEKPEVIEMPYFEPRWSELPEKIVHRILSFAVANEGSVPLLTRTSEVSKTWYEATKTKEGRRDLWTHLDLSTGRMKEKYRSDKKLENFLKKYKNVLEIKLAGWKNSVSSSTLKIIANLCPNLVSLSLASCYKLSSEDLRFIGENFPKLERLDLSNVSSSCNSRSIVSSTCLADFIVAVGERLTYLNISNNKMAGLPFVFKALANNSKNLVEVDISNITTTTRDPIYINMEKLQKGCQKLQVFNANHTMISLTDTPIKEQVLSLGFPELRELHIAVDSRGYFEGLEDSQIERVLKKSEKLRLLDIRGCQHVTDSCLIRLPTWDIEKLVLSGCSAASSSNDGLELIVKKWAPKLVEIDVSGTGGERAVNYAVEAFADSDETKIRKLNLCRTAVGIKSLTLLLKRCSTIEHLNLSACRGLPRGIKRLYGNREDVEKLRDDILAGRFAENDDSDD